MHNLYKKKSKIPKNIFMCPFCMSKSLYFTKIKNPVYDMMICKICSFRTFFQKKARDRFMQNLSFLLTGDREVKEIYMAKKFNKLPYILKYKCIVCSNRETRIDIWNTKNDKLSQMCIMCGSTSYFHSEFMGIIDYFSS